MIKGSSINRSVDTNVTYILSDDTSDSLPLITDDQHVQFMAAPIKVLPDGHLSIYSSVFLIANGALGVGMLNFPQAYLVAGGVKVAVTVQSVSLTCSASKF